MNDPLPGARVQESTGTLLNYQQEGRQMAYVGIIDPGKWKGEYVEAPSVTDTLAQRQHTHGDFTDNATVMQSLKGVARDGVKWGHLNYVQREAIEMILHKIGRIVTGNPNEPDHWLDIEGYARLARERLDRRD
jgi:hypothetical protein